MQKYCAIIIFLVVASFSEVLAQSVQFKIPIQFQSGSFTDTLWLGVHGDGPGGLILDNTYGLDFNKAYGSWGERPYPPDFPGIVFNCKFVDIPNRSEIQAALKPNDFRGFTSISQIDSFAICVCGINVAKGPVTLSWPKNINNFGDAWELLKKEDKKYTVIVSDMMSTAFYTDPNTELAPQLDYLLIKSGVKVDIQKEGQ